VETDDGDHDDDDGHDDDDDDDVTPDCISAYPRALRPPFAAAPSVPPALNNSKLN
jgi:hypothetical protein